MLREEESPAPLLPVGTNSEMQQTLQSPLQDQVNTPATHPGIRPEIVP